MFWTIKKKGIEELKNKDFLHSLIDETQQIYTTRSKKIEW